MTNFRDGYLLRISNQSLRTTLLVVLGRRLSEAASQKTCLLVYIYFKFSRKDAKAVQQYVHRKIVCACPFIGLKG